MQLFKIHLRQLYAAVHNDIRCIYRQYDLKQAFLEYLVQPQYNAYAESEI